MLQKALKYYICDFKIHAYVVLATSCWICSPKSISKNFFVLFFISGSDAQTFVLTEAKNVSLFIHYTSV